MRSIVLTVSDKAKLQSAIDANVGSSQVSSTDYQGQQIKTSPSLPGRPRRSRTSSPTTRSSSRHDVDLLKQALDVKAGQSGSLADDSFFLQQLGALHADRLATFYFDASKQLAPVPQRASSTDPGAVCPCRCRRSWAQAQVVGEVRAESDHLAFTVRSQCPAGDNAPPAPAEPPDDARPGDARRHGRSMSRCTTPERQLGWLIKSLLVLLDCPVAARWRRYRAAWALWAASAIRARSSSSSLAPSQRTTSTSSRMRRSA